MQLMVLRRWQRVNEFNFEPILIKCAGRIISKCKLIKIGENVSAKC